MGIRNTFERMRLNQLSSADAAVEASAAVLPASVVAHFITASAARMAEADTHRWIVDKYTADSLADLHARVEAHDSTQGELRTSMHGLGATAAAEIAAQLAAVGSADITPLRDVQKELGHYAGEIYVDYRLHGADDIAPLPALIQAA